LVAVLRTLQTEGTKISINKYSSCKKRNVTYDLNMLFQDTLKAVKLGAHSDIDTPSN